MLNYLRKNKLELLILLLLTFACNLAMYLQIRGFEITFFDTDDHMRLVRIQEFFKNFDLNNHIIARSNVPFGCSLHWTRFYDFFFIVPAYILFFFTHSMNQAIDYVGFVISPIMKLATVVVVFKLCREILEKRDAFFATALFGASPAIAQFGIFGRPDHHAFIMLFMVIFIDNVVTLIKSNFSKGFLGTALAAALCVWISPETLIPILLTNGVFGLYALVYDDKKIFKALSEINLLTSCFIGVVLAASLPSDHIFVWSLVVLLGAVLFSYRKGDKYFWWISLWMLVTCISMPVYYDEISVVHFCLFVCMSFACAMLAYSKLDRIFVFLCIAFIGVIFLCNYGKIFLGMEAGISDEVKQTWLNNVAEMQSPFSKNPISYTLVSCAVFALLFRKLKTCITELKNYKNFLWTIFITIAFAYTIFGGIANRMIPYAALFTAPLIVDFGMHCEILQNLNRYVRIVVTFLLVMIFYTGMFCFIAVSGSRNGNKNDSDKKEEVSAKELCAELDKLSNVPQVIMAKVDDGPAILHYTKHSVVGAPYHRQQEGILFSYKVMFQPYSEQAVKEILKKTDSSYILVRKSDLESRDRKSLGNMIVKGEYPDYLAPVSLSKKLDGIIVMEIDKSKL